MSKKTIPSTMGSRSEHEFDPREELSRIIKEIVGTNPEAGKIRKVTILGK